LSKSFLIWLCIYECPYHAISFDDGEKTVAKCNLCHHRVDNGFYQACDDNTCLVHSIYFGDPAENEEKVLEKIKLRGGWGDILPKAIRVPGSKWVDGYLHHRMRCGRSF
jgi:Fe-S-cluster-containing dehydrogenase component